ncbi:MAG: ABC transporter permease [Dehalococcoidia bacterium]|nr:ABC transporter permease [Dehalococcoidia bacterium]
MTTYVIRRLLLIIPTLLILTILVFFLVRFLPGNVIDLLEADMEYRDMEIDREALMRLLGLDVPFYVQYARWMEGIFLHGTLGKSLFAGHTVEEKILAGLPVTIQLGAMALVLGQLIALPVGIYSAIRQDTPADYVGRTVAVIGMATPNFWLALLVMIYPGIWWGWSPPMEYISLTEDPVANFGTLIIPAVILGTAMSAGTMRLTRTMMLEVLRQDYIRTARSKGLKERVFILRHTVKNALIPVVTLAGAQLPILVGGSVIMENIFNLPGLGRLFVDALGQRDYPMVSGINLFLASIVLLNNLFIDLLYPYLDPRVRYS